MNATTYIPEDNEVSFWSSSALVQQGPIPGICQWRLEEYFVVLQAKPVLCPPPATGTIKGIILLLLKLMLSTVSFCTPCPPPCIPFRRVGWGQIYYCMHYYYSLTINITYYTSLSATTISTNSTDIIQSYQWPVVQETHWVISIVPIVLEKLTTYT